MTLQLELNPELEARLSAQATQHGMTLDAYVLRLVEGNSSVQSYPTGTGRMTKEEFHKMLDEIALDPENTPSIPTSAFSRESFYEGRP